MMYFRCATDKPCDVHAYQQPTTAPTPQPAESPASGGETNYFGGPPMEPHAEAEAIARNLRATVWADDEVLHLPGRKVRRIAELLALVRRPCLHCGGDGKRFDGGPCQTCNVQPPADETSPKPVEGERVTGPAIKTPDGSHRMVPIPGSHYGVSKLIQETDPAATPLKWEQGFVTNRGRFVDRREAGRIAASAGQIVNPIGGGNELFSEELWRPTPEAQTEPTRERCRDALSLAHAEGRLNAHRHVQRVAELCGDGAEQDVARLRAKVATIPPAEERSGETQCRCVHPNHDGGRCANMTYMHRFCGGCQSEGAIEMPPEPDPRDAEIATLREDRAKMQADREAAEGRIAAHRVRVRELAAENAKLRAELSDYHMKDLTMSGAALRDLRAEIATLRDEEVELSQRAAYFENETQTLRAKVADLRSDQNILIRQHQHEADKLRADLESAQRALAESREECERVKTKLKDMTLAGLKMENRVLIMKGFLHEARTKARTSGHTIAMLGQRIARQKAANRELRKQLAAEITPAHEPPRESASSPVESGEFAADPILDFALRDLSNALSDLGEFGNDGNLGADDVRRGARKASDAFDRAMVRLDPIVNARTPAPRQKAWVIVRPEHVGVRYWIGGDIYSRNVGRAIRFARVQDAVACAETFLADLPSNKWTVRSHDFSPEGA